MNTTFFQLDHIVSVPNNFGSMSPAIYKVPTLPAYAIEYAILKVPPGSAFDTENPNNEEYQGKGFEIKGDTIIWHYYRHRILGPPIPMLFIYYHGIRDYSLLFPNLKIEGLSNRLGHFYEEADKNFESGAWLSFSLMCGAIFEGLLHDRIHDERFNELIKKAEASNLITPEDAKIMHVVREQRNLVHASRHHEPYVSRTMAMDIRKTLDDIIKKFSFLTHNSMD